MGLNHIRSRAEECLKQFGLLLDLPGSLSEHDKAEDVYHANLRMDDQRARFEIWAGNIGVFADEHASLDYRLRNSEDAKKVMISLLETLCTLLTRAKESSKLLQSIPEDFPSTNDSDVYETSTSSAVSSSFQGTETESIDAALAEYIPPSEQRVQGVEKSIDRLYRFSLQVRKPSIAQQNIKAERFPIMDEEGNIIDNEFGQYATNIVAHLFPKCDKRLKERLATGIVRRRRRFLYRQRHQRKLNTKTVVALVEREPKLYPTGSVTNVESTVRGERVSADRPQPNATGGGRPRKLYPPSHTSASLMVQSVIAVDKLDGKSGISTTFTTTSTTTNPVTVPNPPSPAQGSKEFECPYCCIFLSISTATASQWRHHVMEDLEPYCCVFPQCSEHQTIYADRKAWTSHMQNAHTVRWTCNNKLHESCFFESAEEYQDHMRAEHAGAFSEAQLTLLTKRSRIPTPITLESCPLCGHVPTDEEIQSQPQARGFDRKPQSLGKARSDRIIKHLADHLEALAIKALPWQDTEEAGNELEESRHTDGGTLQSQEGSGSLVKLYSSRQRGHDEQDPIEFRFTIDDDSDGYDPEYNGSYEEEWSFWLRPDYYGHDRDPVLQPLLKKLYVDAFSNAATWNGPKLPAYIVPLDCDPNFFAREQVLLTLRDNLCPGQETEELAAPKPVSYPRCFAVYGPGGMGKTQVAAYFAATYRDKFDAVLWVHAENTSKIEQDFKDIAVGLGLVDSSSPNANDLAFTRDALKRWLVNPIKGNPEEKGAANRETATWLLVFDGVEDGEVLNNYWPYDGPGSILITSRNPYSWASSLDLKPFSVDEAAQYLLQCAGRDVSVEEKEAAMNIARRLGGHPLALAQMSGIIVHTNTSFSEFLKSYDEQSGRQELLQRPFDSVRPYLSRYEHNVASVWAFDSLGKGSMLLNIMSMLDPDGVPEKLFQETALDKHFPNLVEIKANYRAARNELLARSLVTGNKGNKKLFIHRLIQDVCRSRMTSSKVREVFLLTVGLVSGWWPFEQFNWRHGVARWAVCEELIPHVQRLKDIFIEMAQTADSLEDYAFAKLLVDAGWYSHERGKFLDAIAFSNKAQSICESLKLRILELSACTDDELATLSQLNRSLAEINHNRGCIASEINEPLNALKHHKEFNTSMVKELSGTHMHDDMRLAVSWNETGCAYMLNQNWVEGEKCFIESIAEMKRINGFIPTMVSLPIANLGLAYWLQGKYDQALSVLLAGLEDRHATFGAEDKVSFITGRLLHAIGNVKNSQGLLDEGREYHHLALLHYKSTLGNRHHRTADLYVKVAEHNQRMQQDDMALVLLDLALEAYASSYHFSPDRLRASLKRINALRALKRDREANLERARCFKIYCKLFHDLAEGTGAKLGQRKTREMDLTDKDADVLIAFWSK